MELEDAMVTPEVKDVDAPPPAGEPPSEQSPRESSTSWGDEQNEAVMPVSEVSAMLEAMREEQLQTLNRIADGVQQLQSQVMVLGETATTTDASMRLCLERLAGLEVRIGSIPVPMKAPDSFQPHQSTGQLSRGGAVGGGFMPVVGRGDVPRVPAFSASPYAPSPLLLAEKAPPPPPPAPSPARVPSWIDRNAERDLARPHFMRSASAQQQQQHQPRAGSGSSVTPSTVQAIPPAPAAAAAEPAVLSPEEAAKEAKRKAFIEDRARMQARIAARKSNTNAGASSAKPSAPTAAPSTAAASPAAYVAPQTSTTPEARQTVQTQLQGGFGSGFSAGGGIIASGSAAPFSGNPGFVGGVVEGGIRETTAEDQAEWLERERALRERKEKERQEAAERERKRREEEEARLEREKAEAKRRKEEEEARLLREAEEARERERKKREMEARRQAKTRVIMSSLFDKEETGGGNSLFGGLGAALPAGGSVFDDGGGSTSSSNYNSGGSGGPSFAAASAMAVTEGPPAEGEKSASSGAVPVSALPYPVGGGGSGGSLFAGMDDVGGNDRAARGGLFDGIVTPASPVAPRPSPEEVMETRNYSGDGGGESFKPESSTLFAPSPRRKDPAAPPAGAEDAAGPPITVAADDQANADEEIDRIFSSDGIGGNDHGGADGTGTGRGDGRGGDGDYRGFVAGGQHNVGGDDYDYDDEYFLSTDASGRGVTSAAATGGSLFPDDDNEEDDDNVFSSPAAGRGAKGMPTITAAEAAAVVGGGSGREPDLNVRGSGTSLFDRPEFSIGGVDDDGGVFGRGSGVAGGAGSGGVSEVAGDGSSAAFLTALGELDLGSQGQDRGQVAPDRDGMVDVSL